MDRDLWDEYPAETLDEKLLVALLPFSSDRVEVEAAGPRGRRLLTLVRTLSVEEPFGGKAQVVSRIDFEGERPAGDERVSDDPWRLAADFFAVAERAARALRQTLILAPDGEPALVEVTHDGVVHRFAARE